MTEQIEKVRYELRIYKAEEKLLKIVKAVKDYTGSGLKFAKSIIDSSPSRRSKFDTKELEIFFNETNSTDLNVSLENDHTKVEFLMSRDYETGFRNELEEVDCEFTLNCLKQIREDKLSQILD